MVLIDENSINFVNLDQDLSCNTLSEIGVQFLSPKARVKKAEKYICVPKQ